ncbi:MAG: hypothetical protein ACLFTK_14985 [Anaerolineales bacterium]
MQIQPVGGDASKDIFAYGSLGLGGVNIVLGCCISWIPLLSLISCCVFLLAPTGLVLGFIGRESTQRQYAQIGMILNGVALLGYLVIFMLSFAFGLATGLSDATITTNSIMISGLF